MVTFSPALSSSHSDQQTLIPTYLFPRIMTPASLRYPFSLTRAISVVSVLKLSFVRSSVNTLKAMSASPWIYQSVENSSAVVARDSWPPSVSVPDCWEVHCCTDPVKLSMNDVSSWLQCLCLVQKMIFPFLPLSDSYILSFHSSTIFPKP